MIKFADPGRCPGCGGYLPHRPDSCPSCGLSLRGELPGQLFATLRQADALLTQLRAATPSVQPPTPAQPPPPGHSSPTARTGLSSATVPRVLLGLGALCLVVAALIFLAVTWSALGVGGRTAVLLALAVAAFAGARLVARRSLPAAAESFTVIGLAFAGLTLAGAARAGWLPPMGGGAFTALLGALLAALGLATAEDARRVTAKILYTGELALGLGAGLLVVGAVAAWPGQHEFVLFGAVLIAAGAARLSARDHDFLRRVLFLILFGACWAALTISALVRAARHASLDGLWAHGNIWPLLAAAALAAAAAALTRVPLPARIGAAAVAATLAWTGLWLPIAAIESATTAIAVTLAPVLLASAAVFLAPASWRVAAAVPLGFSAVVPAGALFALSRMAAARVAAIEPWTATFGSRLPASNAPVSALLMAPLALALLVGAAAFTRLFTDPLPRFARGAVPIGAGLALVATSTVAHAAAPIALVVGLILAIGVGVAAWSLLARREQWLWLTAAIMALALWFAASADWFTAITLSVIAGLAGTLALLARSDSLRATGDAILPPALAGALWILADLAGLSAGARALTVIVALSALVIWRPRVAGESATVVTVFLALALSTAATTTAASGAQSALTWLAINLTVGGALAGVHSLVSASRSHIRWLSGAMILLASWIRLGQVGVTTPEAYTGPAALVLLVVGVLALRRDPRLGTHRALGAGLLLALAPSLLWALADPISLRGLLLGLGCVALVLAGATLSWNAPLVYGAAAGTLLALREAAPWAAQMNPWIITGALGVVLTAFGITWESRVQELRRSQKYLARLR